MKHIDRIALGSLSEHQGWGYACHIWLAAAATCTAMARPCRLQVNTSHEGTYLIRFLMAEEIL